jgi:hypothetical protein
MQEGSALEHVFLAVKDAGEEDLRFMGFIGPAPNFLPQCP